MKAFLLSPLLALLITPLLRGDVERRSDIASEIPLTVAVKLYNEKYPDSQPLTVEEVVASVRNIKATHPNISEPIYRIYQRVAQEQVLPPGVYFSRITGLQDENFAYDVDWKDLTLAAIPPAQKDPVYGYGFNYRIRARFIQSRPLTAEEKREQEVAAEKYRKVKEKLEAAKRAESKAAAKEDEEPTQTP